MSSKECLKRIDEKNYLTEREHREFLSVIEKCLDRLEKLEKFISLIKTKKCCLNDISPSSWNDKGVYKEMCNYDYYLFALEANHYSLKDKERILTQEEFNLIKELFENDN